MPGGGVGAETRPAKRPLLRPKFRSRQRDVISELLAELASSVVLAPGPRGPMYRDTWLVSTFGVPIASPMFLAEDPPATCCFWASSKTTVGLVETPLLPLASSLVVTAC